jgi:hypothetical protein
MTPSQMTRGPASARAPIQPGQRPGAVSRSRGVVRPRVDHQARLSNQDGEWILSPIDRSRGGRAPRLSGPHGLPRLLRWPAKGRWL